MNKLEANNIICHYFENLFKPVYFILISHYIRFIYLIYYRIQRRKLFKVIKKDYPIKVRFSYRIGLDLCLFFTKNLLIFWVVVFSNSFSLI